MSVGPIDTAYVEIKPDTGSFLPQLQRQLSTAFGRIENTVSNSMGGVRRQFEKAGESAESTFRETARVADREYEKIQRSAKENTSRIGGSFKSLIGGVVAGFGAFGALQFGKSIVSEASDLNESLNAVQVVLGSAGASFIKFGKTAATSLGLTQAELNQAITPMASLFANAGLHGERLSQNLQSLATRATDVGSVFNTTTTDVLGAFGAALRGESEPIRRFGVNLTEASVGAEAVRLGLAKSATEVSESAKVQARYSLVLKQTAAVQGDFANTSTGVANASRIAAAQFGEAKAKLGTLLLPVVAFGARLFGNFADIITNTVVPGIRALGGAFQEGDVTSDGFVGVMERIGVAARQVWAFFQANILPMLRAFVALIIAIIPGVAGFIRLLIDWREVLLPIGAGILAIAAAMKIYHAGVVVVAAITKAWAAVQLFLNAAMAANPIGLIVLALVGLVAAVTVAWKTSETFRNVVTTAWKGIQDAASFAWNNVLKPIFGFFVAAWQAVVTAAQAFWAGLVTVWNGIVTVATWAWNNVLKPIFEAIRIATIPLVIGFKLWWAVMDVVLHGIGMLVSWLWTSVIQPVFNFIGAHVGAVFRGIAAAATWAWNSVLKPIFGFIRNWIIGPLLTAWNLLKSGVGTVWNGIATAAQTAWTRLQPVFKKIGDAITWVKTAFGIAKTAIGQAWNAIKAAVGRPIQWVINTVIVDGIVGLFNKVAKFVGAGGLKVSKVNWGFAEGGVLPGYTPGRDVHHFYNPQLGRLSLSGGEAIMRPEFVRMVGGPAGVAQLNSRAKHGYAGGGVLDWIGGKVSGAWDWVKQKAGDIWNVLSNPGKIFGGITNWVTQHLGGSPLVQMGKGLVSKGIGLIVEKVKSLFGGMGAGGAAPGAGVQRWAGTVARVLNLLHLPLSWLNTVLRRMMRESGGNQYAINLWDINARRGDPSRGLMQTIGATFNAYAGPYRGLGIYHPLANIYAALRYTLARYGTLAALDRPGGYDTGGILRPGQLGANLTRRPERILSPDQTVLFERLVTRLEGRASDQAVAVFRLHPDDIRALGAELRAGMAGAGYEAARTAALYGRTR